MIRPKKGLKSEFHEKQTQTSFRTTIRMTYYGRTQKFDVFLISGINGLKCLNKMKYINQKYFLHVKSMHMQFAFVWKKKSQNNQEHC